MEILALLSKQKAAGLSVCSNLFLTFIKLAVGIASGSLSIIAEAAHSGFDLLASFVAYISVRISDRPADRNHPYGHHKLENASGVVESALIFLVAAWIVIEAVQKIRGHRQIAHLPVGIAIMVISLAMNIAVSRVLYHVAKRTRSIALEADAAHLHSDVLTSAGVIATLLLMQAGRTFWQLDLFFLDSVFSVVISVFILKLAWDLLRKSYPSLLDERADSEVEEKILNRINEFCSQCYLFHKLRTRQSGSKVHIDFHLQFLPDTSIETAHILSHELVELIKKDIPGSEVIIDLEPIEEDVTEDKP